MNIINLLHMRKIKNTKQCGIARILTFPSDTGYTSVCLDFDLIEEAKTRDAALEQMKESVEGYLQCVLKNNLSDNLLNRHADKEYWDMYNQYLKLISERGNNSASEPVKNASLYSMPLSGLIPA
ncbi:MAG: hypothetical protein MUD10_02710 [Candidatus Pacebacteria bacterium]|jgi:hypothetical protein|nr:hypothetical protein [Candidatus Paceibacterota bacterium]